MFIYSLIGLITLIIGYQFYIFLEFLNTNIAPSVFLMIIGILSIVISFIKSIKNASKKNKKLPLRSLKNSQG